MSIFDNPAVVAIVSIVVAAIPSTILGYLTHRRSVRVDRLAEKQTSASEKITTAAQLIEGMDKHMENLGEDNKSLRDEVGVLRDKLVEIGVLRDKVRELEQLVSVLQREIDILKRELASHPAPPSDATAR